GGAGTPHQRFAEVSCVSYFLRIMNLLLLGRGKTGSLIADVARERKHHIRVAGATENAHCAAVTAEKLRDIDVVIDFTTPQCVVANIEACIHAGKNTVVGTTGWYDERDRIRSEEHTSELQSPCNLVCRLLLEKKNILGS